MNSRRSMWDMGIPPLRLGVYHEPASGFLGPDLNRSEIKPLGDTPRGTPPFAERALRNIWPLADLASLHLDVSRLDHFGPFFGVFNDDLSEIRKLGRRANRHLQRYTARGPLARKKRFLERLFWTNDVADAAKKLALGSVQTGIDGSGGTDGAVPMAWCVPLRVEAPPE
jgi:hypothetical protein